MFLFNVFRETGTNGYNGEYIVLISLLSIFFGVWIIIAKNPVISVLFLIGLFFTISLYLMMLGLYFIGLSYLLVYVGAVSILFIFILMLINVRVSELVTEGKNSIPLAITSVLCFNITVSTILPYCVSTFDIFTSFILYSYRFIYNKLFLGSYDNVNEKAFKQIISMEQEVASVNSKSWEGSLIESNHISSIGNILYTNLFILLIITSLILLLAMVGTIIITVRKKASVTTTTFNSL